MCLLSEEIATHAHTRTILYTSIYQLTLWQRVGQLPVAEMISVNVRPGVRTHTLGSESEPTRAFQINCERAVERTCAIC